MHTVKPSKDKKAGRKIKILGSDLDKTVRKPLAPPVARHKDKTEKRKSSTPKKDRWKEN